MPKHKPTIIEPGDEEIEKRDGCGSGRGIKMIPNDMYIGIFFVAAILALFLISQILEHGIGRVVMAVLAEAAIIIVIFAIGYFAEYPVAKMGLTSLFAIVFSITSVIMLWVAWRKVIRYGNN